MYKIQMQTYVIIKYISKRIDLTVLSALVQKCKNLTTWMKKKKDLIDKQNPLVQKVDLQLCTKCLSATAGELKMSELLHHRVEPDAVAEIQVGR